MVPPKGMKSFPLRGFKGEEKKDGVNCLILSAKIMLKRC